MQYAIKKIFTLSVCLSLSSLASANGFYIGAGVGGIGMKNKLTSTTSVTILNQSNAYSDDDYATDYAVNGTALLGYSLFFTNKTFLALEAFANYTNLSVNNAINDTDASVNSSLQIHSVYGLRILPGYQITPATVLYAIAGYALANSKIQSSLQSTGGLASNEYNSSKYLNGYQLGLGAMKHINSSVALRGDIIYTGYQETTVTTTSEDNTINNTYKIKPYTLETNVALVYQFG